MKKILLVDGNSLLFRAYYASAYAGPILKTSNGIPTNAIYSFANMLTSLISDRDYFDVKVAFDKSKKTFRHDKLENYKAGRSATPEDLIPQFQIVREFLDSANISWWEKENYEADDLIGTMSKIIESHCEDFEVEILTSDKDMFQLITNKTKILLPKTGTSNLELFGTNELLEKWEVAPANVVDLKGLMGDPSDNLKGVEGVGEKTAIKLLKEYKTVEGIYENIESITGKLKEKLINGKESAFLCKEIATINCEVEIEDLKFEPINVNLNGLINFLEKYEMISLVKRLSSRVGIINKFEENLPKEKTLYKQLEKWNNLYSSEINFVYVESIEENYHKGEILGIAISNEKGFFYLNQFKNDNELQDFFSESKYKKATYDIKKTATILKNNNIKFNYDSFIYDAMVASYVLNPNITSRIQNLVNIVETELFIEEDEMIYGKGAKQNKEIEVSTKADFIISKLEMLKNTYEPIINKLMEENQFDLYKKIELPLVKVLFEMEQKGILIDKLELDKQTARTLSLIEELEERMKTVLQGQISNDFNFGSPKQIKELLFDQIGLPSNKKQSTDREALEKIVHLHPVVQLLLEHRKLNKLYSTYLRGFEKFIFEDNKVHTIFNQTLTNTGRLSSSEPNIQNISVKDELQKEARKIFISNNDTTFYSFDYSQIELRVLAQLGEEDTLLDIFKNDRDVHAEAARKIFNLEQEDVITSDQRRIAKVFNFGIIYGLSDFGLSNDLKISIKDAKKFIEDYYNSFAKLMMYKDSLVNEATVKGYAETYANRRRIVNELTSTNFLVKSFGNRIAVNMPIQGTAADILKVAMVDIFEQFKNNNLNSFMVAQIHDEIIFEIFENEEKLANEIIEECMKNAFKKLAVMVGKKADEIVIKLEVNKSKGNNWFELK
ncbi:DNA polymerase I [Mesoplasma entomophilum]|uniref:DNA polymerase I n=1 Tax=Mesoplasma entomophilum TaxID=2149 RepID=A0A3S5Y0P4_9MOLU|nr:DNA polymerase I [Mesoplasma entomophilum]ATQ35761.1 DNA polymerase I [Mesoplasma entomophilum]ATZ19730.1 DNA polymerase I [Mesoplasma entomophilum]